MTRNDVDTLESLLVEIAAIACHLETSITFIQHNRPVQAIYELHQALAVAHKCKLHVMAVRWMQAPRTFHKLIEQQLEWLKRRYP